MRTDGILRSAVEGKIPHVIHNSDRLTLDHELMRIQAEREESSEAGEQKETRRVARIVAIDDRAPLTARQRHRGDRYTIPVTTVVVERNHSEIAIRKKMRPA